MIKEGLPILSVVGIIVGGLVAVKFIRDKLAIQQQNQYRISEFEYKNRFLGDQIWAVENQVLELNRRHEERGSHQELKEGLMEVRTFIKEIKEATDIALECQEQLLPKPVPNSLYQ